MNWAVLLMGGNLGNVPLTFSLAKTMLTERIGKIQSESSLYISPAWGFESNYPFYNQALILNASYSAENLLKKLLEIETHFGRVRLAEQRYCSRTLDIDILFFNHDIINSENLQIPHPRLHLRNFALVPLAELIPDFVHPLLRLTIKQLLLQSPDKIQVHKL